MVFDVTLNGYDGETDATDHLVKWVKAPNRKVLDRWLEVTGLTPYANDVREMAGRGDLTFEDGVDVELSEKGDAAVATWNIMANEVQEMVDIWIRESKLATH